MIEKHPLSKEAWRHIENTAHAYDALAKRYQDSGLVINRCRLERANGSTEIKVGIETEEPYLSLAYVEGRTLEEILDDCLKRNDIERFGQLFDEYYKRISYGEEEKIADYDLIFSNIIVPENIDNAWNVIDCEWSFEKAIETKQIAFRSVYCYLLENEKRNSLNLDLIIRKLGIDQSDAEQYRKREMDFQKYVTGKHMSMAQMREAIGRPVYTVEAFCEGQALAAGKDRIQIYEDTGRGFNEEQSFFIDETVGEQYAYGKME